jgi:hypothetical protein
MMETELRITAADMAALIEKRYHVKLEAKTDDGPVHYRVCGDPLAVAKIYGAIKRAAKTQ